MKLKSFNSFILLNVLPFLPNVASAFEVPAGLYRSNCINSFKNNQSSLMIRDFAEDTVRETWMFFDGLDCRPDQLGYEAQTERQFSLTTWQDLKGSGAPLPVIRYKAPDTLNLIFHRENFNIMVSEAIAVTDPLREFLTTIRGDTHYFQEGDYIGGMYSERHQDYLTEKLIKNDRLIEVLKRLDQAISKGHLILTGRVYTPETIELDDHNFVSEDGVHLDESSKALIDKCRTSKDAVHIYFETITKTEPLIEKNLALGIFRLPETWQDVIFTKIDSL